MKTKDLFMYVLGAVISICFFVVIGLLIFQGMPEQNSEVLYLAIGALIGFTGSVVNYFYGSSKGSSDKNEMFKK
jgi:drug/metabolite transporter (DMT)-like permease